MRTDERNIDWPERPWIMAGIGAVAGYLLWLCVRQSGPSVGEQSFATFVVVATLAFFITAERLRWPWAVAFSVGWGLIVALVGWTTASYNQPGMLLEWPYFAAILAVLVAAPLFQTMRDEGRAVLPYPPIHRYAWTDAIIGATSLAFTGLSFLLLFLFAALFRAIGITILQELLQEGWFALPVAGIAFGGISAVLRERDALLETLHKLVRVIVSTLAPVLAGAMVLFLIALPLTGFAGLWRSGLPETPLLLTAAAFAFVILNAILGDSPDDRKQGGIWAATEYALAGAILPLGVLALVSMMMRVGQYGWTPERIWGVIAALVATAYGAAAWLAILRGRKAFDAPLREYQKKLAVGLCGLALFLALPIVDFGAVSARSQMARLAAGKVNADEFDWSAMATMFGPSGRERLAEIAKSGNKDLAKLAATALKGENRYDVDNAVKAAAAEDQVDDRIKLLPEGSTLTPEMRKALAGDYNCRQETTVCVAYVADENHFILAQQVRPGLNVMVYPYERRGAEWVQHQSVSPEQATPPSLANSTVTIGEVTQRQLFVDGKPVGQPFP